MASTAAKPPARTSSATSNACRQSPAVHRAGDEDRRHVGLEWLTIHRLDANIVDCTTDVPSYVRGMRCAGDQAHEPDDQSNSHRTFTSKP